MVLAVKAKGRNSYARKQKHDRLRDKKVTRNIVQDPASYPKTEPSTCMQLILYYYPFKKY